MSKLDSTTQELFQRLGATTMSRRAKADALFRRLRFDTQDQIADALSRAPRRLDAKDINGEPASINKNSVKKPRGLKTAQ